MRPAPTLAELLRGAKRAIKVALGGSGYAIEPRSEDPNDGLVVTIHAWTSDNCSKVFDAALAALVDAFPGLDVYGYFTVVLGERSTAAVASVPAEVCAPERYTAIVRDSEFHAVPDVSAREVVFWDEALLGGTWGALDTFEWTDAAPVSAAPILSALEWSAFEDALAPVDWPEALPSRQTFVHAHEQAHGYFLPRRPSRNLLVMDAESHLRLDLLNAPTRAFTTSSRIVRLHRATLFEPASKASQNYSLAS